jgi:hypothetical protein
MADEEKRKDYAITPNLRKRLEEMFADSPLNDEPLTKEQEDAVDRLMKRLKDETEPAHRPLPS